MHTQDRSEQLISMTLKALHNYVNFVQFDSLHAGTCTETVAMHAEDIKHVAGAVQQFAYERNEQQLLDALVMQDTFVREYFADVIIAIDSSMACN